jgi:hypothetical protein
MGRVAAVILLAAALAACGQRQVESGTYTLYCSSLAARALRVHVARFDAEDPRDADFNKANCQRAADLYMRQLGNRSRYWCEESR